MVSLPDPVPHVPRVGKWQRCYLNADAYVEGNSNNSCEHDQG